MNSERNRSEVRRDAFPGKHSRLSKRKGRLGRPFLILDPLVDNLNDAPFASINYDNNIFVQDVFVIPKLR